MMDSLNAFRSVDTGYDASEGLHRLTQVLGWSGVGIGLIELTMPSLAGRAMGLEDRTANRVAMRGMGLGNLATGLGIVLRPRRATPMWIRVAGDAVSLGVLAWAGLGKRSSGQRLAASLVAGGTALAIDAYVSRRVTRAQDADSPELIASVTINKSPAEVYAFFRKLENLPRFMDYLQSVEPSSPTHSRWVAKLPFGRSVAWDAEIIEDRAGERIAWKTDASSLTHRGEVTFARRPGGSATEVRVKMELGLPGIAPSGTLAKLLTKGQIKGDLRRLKQVMETGEVLFSDASAHEGKHPSQPSVEATQYARARAAESRQAAHEGSRS